MCELLFLIYQYNLLISYSITCLLMISDLTILYWITNWWTLSWGKAFIPVLSSLMLPIVGV